MRVSRRWAREGSFSVSFSRDSRRASSSSEVETGMVRERFPGQFVGLGKIAGRAIWDIVHRM